MAAAKQLRTVRALAAVLALAAAMGCGGAPLVPELGFAASPSSALPIEPDELVQGNPDAPVTVVSFIDYGSPAAGATVRALERARRAQPDDVRYVLKPLPSCESAGSRAAADAAEAVLALRGPEALWRFQTVLLRYPARLTPSFLKQTALDVGLTPAELPLLADARFAARVERQIVLARRLGVAGAPSSFVNGYEVTGVLDSERLEQRLQVERGAAEALADRGQSAHEIYATRVAQNLRARNEATPREPAGVQRVSVSGSATRGLPDARLTLVEFASFTNGCAKAAQASIERLERTYGARLRRVFKHAAETLPARQAANFAEHARATGGDDKFFQAARLLWQASPDLSPATLERLARVLGLEPQAALLAVASDRYGERIDADRALADDLGLERAPGGGGYREPVLFVNGQRVPAGASDQALDALLEQRLAEAQTRLAAGTPANALYDALLAHAPRSAATAAPRELDAERVPYRGAHGAPVRVEMFASYASAACSIPDSLQALFVEYPERIQLSFRPLVPLADSDVERELRATEAALEAHAQLGNAGFWHMARLICGDAGRLSAAELERYAGQVRLDVARFRAALAERRYQTRIDQSGALAARWGFERGPRFVINGERLWGEPLRARVQRLLAGAN
jgi:protein-disulfide isomerase